MGSYDADEKKVGGACEIFTTFLFRTSHTAATASKRQPNKRHQNERLPIEQAPTRSTPKQLE